MYSHDHRRQEEERETNNERSTVGLADVRRPDVRRPDDRALISHLSSAQCYSMQGLDYRECQESYDIPLHSLLLTRTSIV